MTRIHELARLLENIPSHDWLDRAACGDLGLEQLDMFFVEAGRSLSKEASALCAGCAVREECLRYAVDAEIAGGYFGGMSPSKRRKEAQLRAGSTAEPLTS